MDTASTRVQAASRESLSVGFFVVAALASFALSVTLWFSGNEQQGIFVGLWVPSILSLGALLLASRSGR